MRKKKLLKEKIAAWVVSMAVLVALLMVAGSLDPLVRFSDRGLEEAIRDKLNKPLHKSDLLIITELDASGRNIKTLDGIENLRKLVTLDLGNNFVEDLSPLSGLEMLRELDLGNNRITDLKAAGFAAVAGLPLRKLGLQANVAFTPGGDEVRLSDISLLRNMLQLEELDLRGNSISDITPLAALTDLRSLDLRDNDLTGIEPLNRFKELLYLNIHSNKNIRSLEPLSGLEKLQTLVMRNVPAGEQIDVLGGLVSLRYLNARNCGINDLRVIGELMSLGALQDDAEAGIEAYVDIRDNGLFIKEKDPYDPVRPYWENIAHRFPLDLRSYLGPPQFSHPGGFYEEDLLLELTTDVPGAIIYYTLDGSCPEPDNTGGTVYHYKNSYPFDPGDPFGELIERTCQTYLYKKPVPIKNRPSDSTSISRINPTNSAVAPVPPGDVFSGTVVRAITYRDGSPVSPVVTKSYFAGKKVNERYNLPVVSVVTDERNLFDYQSGIYVAGKIFDEWREENPAELLDRGLYPGNYSQRGADREKEVNLEYFDGNGSLILDQIAGVRIHGGVTRFEKAKSLRFYARSEYGSKLFNIQFFQSKDNDRFRHFILRNSGNDINSTMFRDALLQSLVKSLGIDHQAYQPSILFVNGVFWGIYNIRDRIDRHYLQYEHGVDPDNIDLLVDYGSVYASVEEGSNDHYLSMVSFLKNNDIKTASAYDRVNSMMDIENYINYTTSQIYFGNTDWPGANIAYWRLRTDRYEPEAPYGHDGRWRWILYDTDFGFGLYDIFGLGEQVYLHNTLAFATETGGDSWPNPDWSTFLLRTLLQNNKFRFDFINRFADHLNTIFLPEVVIAKIDVMQANIAPCMQEHIDRWGEPRSIEAWEKNVEAMKVYARRRPEALRSHIAGHFGLSGTAVIVLRYNPSKGAVIVNTVDTSQLIRDNEPSTGWTGCYFKDVPICITAVPKPGFVFSGWVGSGDKSETLNIVLTGNIDLTAEFDRQE